MNPVSSMLIRADAGVRMGTGHVMRCLGLAQARQAAGGQVFYAMAAGSNGVEERLRRENIEIVSVEAEPGAAADARATAAAAARLSCDWIVLDGYHFDSDYQRVLKQSEQRLLVMDDLGALPCYCADIVVNQDPIADERMYLHRASETQLLLGTEYTFLRREFLQRSRTRRESVPVARKLLVTLGGSDPDNVTEKVIRCLDDAGIDGLEATVLVGPSNPHGTRLELAARSCRTRVRLLRDPGNIPELMAECDFAVVAGGSTLWELAYFYVPSLVLVLAENQDAATSLLHARGACRRLGFASQVSEQELAAAIFTLGRDAAARAGLGLTLGDTTDGRGGDRVCAAMRISGGGPALLAAAASPKGQGR
jgi:UDP-2,4-diacetamido-2,4,6-trideoxy-beta-L-altropyranose hydrolase